MGADPALASMAVFVAVFLAVCGLGFVVFLRAYGDRRRAVQRLRELSAAGDTDAPRPGAAGAAGAALPRLGSLLFREEERLASLRSQLLQAGHYGQASLRVFMGAKLLLMVGLPLGCAALPWALGVLPGARLPLAAVVACAVGMWLPDLWLRRQVRRRQRLLRLGMPDVLDMLVLCLESGVSLIAAFQRVTEELLTVHPELGEEMVILWREIQLGLTPGAAMRKFAQRCGLDEARELAAALLQAEHYGASVAKALRRHADDYRRDRQARAEERAQQAAVKILFPTLLCIFPAIFVVLLGPAALQLARIFAR